MKPHDTGDEALAVQRELWARLGPDGRLRLALQMSDEMRDLAIAGVQARTGLCREEARQVVIRRMLGDELYERAFGSR